MTVPFVYPATPHHRPYGPVGYADYEGYRPWLRDEFTFRCVFCLTRETWGPFHAQFAIDHFIPAKALADEPVLYENLLYSCVTCNSIKGARTVPDPLVVLLDSSVVVTTDGVMDATTAEARKLIELLDLNHPKKTEFRAQWIAVVGLSQRLDPKLFRRLMDFPDDLPDLSRLRPPGGNARPEGVAGSHYARRVRGELPDCY